MTLCLIAAAVTISLMTEEITLSWRHSVEHTLWQEVWRATPEGLRLIEARVQGSGAGMDPPPEAVLEDGFWTWRPSLPPLPEVILRRSGATADWRLCRGANCAPMSELLPEEADPVRLTTCEGGPSPSAAPSP